MAFSGRAEFPSHGVPDASDDITGGIGLKGCAICRQFVARAASWSPWATDRRWPLEGGLVRHVRKAPASSDARPASSSPRFPRPDHPIAYGYPWRDGRVPVELTVYDTPRAGPHGLLHVLSGRPRRSASAVLDWGAAGQFPPGESMVVSGGAQNEGHSRGIPRSSPCRGSGAHRSVQLQPDAPGPEPFRLPPAVERGSELARPARVGGAGRAALKGCATLAPSRLSIRSPQRSPSGLPRHDVAQPFRAAPARPTVAQPFRAAHDDVAQPFRAAPATM